MKQSVKVLTIVVMAFILGYFLDSMTIEDDYLENFEILAELFTVFASFSIFAVTWIAYRKSRDNHALFIGSVFLMIGILDLFHFLSYPFMPDFITANSHQKSIIFWSMSRIFSAFLFFASVYVYKDTFKKSINKYFLIIYVIFITFSSFIAVLFYPGYLPLLEYPDGSATGLREYQIILTAIIIFCTSYLYLKRVKHTGEKNLNFFIYGIIIATLSDLVYFDLEVIGHLLKIIAFYYIFIALYETSVELPYEKLAIAEEKLRNAAEEKYRNLFDNANDAIILHDLEGTIISWNKAAEKVFGWTAQEVTGENVSKIIVPEDFRVEMERLSRSIVPGETSYFEPVLLRKDGKKIIAGLTLSNIKDAGGNVTGISCIIRDVTEHKQAEEEIIRSKEFTETILNSMNDGISVVNVKDFRIIDANKVFLDMYGIKKEDVIGKTCYELTHNHDSPCNFFNESCPLLETVRTGKFSTVEHVHPTKNGTRYDEVSTSPIRDETGNVINVIHVTRDITERKKAEALRLENERLILANRTKSEFLATMSHELRTPLNAVLGFSELLKNKIAGELNEKQETYVDYIIKGGKQQLNLIDMILDMTTLETSKLDLTLARISVPMIIEEALALLKDQAAKRKVAIKTIFDPALPEIFADGQRFKEIIFNLVDNAIKFSKPEGGTVTITSKIDSSMARFTVSDTGIGIKEEDMGKLFRLFQQIDTGMTRKYGGSGLGLAITKQLVELHGGTIKMESKFGEGTTFTFTLPVGERK